MEDIRLEDVRSRAEAYYVALLNGIDAISHSQGCDRCIEVEGYLAEKRRAAHMTGFIIGFSDAEIDEHIRRHMKGAACNDHD